MRLKSDFDAAYEDAVKKHFELFSASRECQFPEHWLRLLGEALISVKAEAAALVPEKVTVERVQDLVAHVGRMLSISDFILDQFGNVEG